MVYTPRGLLEINCLKADCKRSLRSLPRSSQMLFTNFLFATPCYQSDPSYSTYARLKTQPALYLFCSTKKKDLGIGSLCMKRTTFWWQEWEQKLSNSWWQVNPALNREGQAERTHCMQRKETLQWNCANSQNLEQTELVVKAAHTLTNTIEAHPQLTSMQCDSHFMRL